ncbi:hypothetical protein [Neisseria perflava]|uniref:hypothetical protein n=1 Tax=Neisseria perflava TaxID=33053 RepID=UPI00209FBCB4|nr:hypothetical protein [Neisseria perflava]MCP1659175.1 hypothetical protein [Neisseria perflava]MCP1771783.1 hypothetical protein [Neisseria perflava]
MSLTKLMFPLSVALLLAACGQDKTEPAASAPASAPAAQTASAASDTLPANLNASAASDTAASDAAASSAAPANLGGKLADLNQAKWQAYTCAEGGKIEVRYYASKAGPSAQVKFKGATFTAPYSPELSDEDLSAFSNGEQTWTIGNEFETDFYKESNGFLVRHEQLEGMGEEGIVDNLLVQDCSPVGK